MASLRGPLDHRMLERQVSVVKPGTVDINDKDIFAIVMGRMDNLPPITSRLVKVFVSSTFSDMVKERDILMEIAYPELKEFCRQRHGLEFQMMDLRWGIQDQSRIDHTTLDFCLQEIDNCRQNSVGPSFVLFIGQKYGYRPIPSTIKDTEFEAIRQALVQIKENVAILDTWYKKDTNRIPAQYQLQPISSLLKNIGNQEIKEHEKDEAEWNKTFQKLQFLLRRGVEMAVNNDASAVSDIEKYFISVTEWEINRGLVEHPSPHSHCLLFERIIKNLKDRLSYDRAQKFIDLQPDSKKPDMESLLKQDRMKKRKLFLLMNESNKNAKRFEINWNDAEAADPNDNATYLKEFCDSFISMMKETITQTTNSSANIVSDSYVREIVQHLSMCQTRCKSFIGRESEIMKIRACILNSCQQIVVVHGYSGTGKTSVMAKVTSLLPNWFSDHGDPVIIARFLGTTARSSSIRLVLGSVCWQIATAYNCDVQQIPTDYPGLVKHFHELLQTISTSSRPLVILLDSLDQLSPSHHAHSLLWVPRVLPANVHFVLSTLPEEYDLLKILHTIVTEQNHFIEILPLGQNVGLEVFDSWLSEVSRKITIEQNEIVRKALAECSLPLYMKLIFDKVCQWKSYSPVDETILEPTIKGVIHSLFDRVEKYYGKIYVKHVLSYMTASKYGLSDVEMEDLLSLDDVVLDTVFSFWIPPVRRIPPALLPRLYNELRPYITLREANGQIVFYWYHRQFIDVVNQRYLTQLQHRQYIHSILADYFMGKWGGGVKKPYRLSPRLMGMLNQKEPFAHADRKVPLQPLVFGLQTNVGLRHRNSGVSIRYNLRKLSELPHHLIESKRFAELRDEVLFNYQWIYVKLKATSLQDVLSDFRSAIEAGVNDRATQTVLGALRLGGHVLASNPDTLAFELLARLVSYYDQCKYVARLLQQCDLESREQTALLPVYQCYDAPRGMLLYILDHEKTVIDIIFSTSTNELICASEDRSIGFWDLSTGERIHATAIPPVEEAMSLINMKLYLSSDGKYLACDPGSNGSPVFIYDVKTGQLLHRVGQKSPLQKRTFQAGDLLCRQKSIINMRTGEIVGDLDDLIPSKKFVVCNITPDEIFIVFGENDKINIFNMIKKECVAKIPCNSPPSVIAISKDSTKAFVGFSGSCQLKVIDMDKNSGNLGKVLKEFNYLTAFPALQTVHGNMYFQEVAEIALLPARSDVVLLNIKRCILICVYIDSKTSQVPVMLDTSNKDMRSDDNAQFYDIALVSDNIHIYAVARCGSLLCIWNGNTGQVLTLLKPHSAGRFTLAVAGKNFGKPMVAASSFIQAAVKIWDLSKTQDNEASPLTVYECPVNQVASAPDRRLLFVKNGRSLYRSDGYKLIDHFGIDVWNLSTGKSKVCLPFHQYGRLLQMEVSRTALYLGLLLVTREETYLAVLGLRADLPPVRCLPHWAAKSFIPSTEWRFIATYAEEDSGKSVKLWEMRTATEILRLEKAQGPIFTYDSLHMLLILLDQIVLVKLSGLPAVHSSFGCNAASLKPIPNNNSWVLVLDSDDSGDCSGAGRFSKVTIWDFIAESPLITVNNLSPGGISDMSKDGCLMIDNFLQIYNIKTGQMVYGLTPADPNADHIFVRLTHDGLYTVAVDSSAVTVYRNKDGKVVSRTSTHEKTVSLEMFEFGYLHALGHEDGRVSITKLVTGKFTEKIENVYERTRQLLKFPTCSVDLIGNLDLNFQYMADEVDYHENLAIKPEVYAQLSTRANPPMVISIRPRVASHESLPRMSSQISLDLVDNSRAIQLFQEPARRRSSQSWFITKIFRRSKDYNVSLDSPAIDKVHHKDAKRKAKTLGMRSRDFFAKDKSNSMQDINSTRSVINVGTMVLSVADMAARSQATAPRSSPAKKSITTRSSIAQLFQPAPTATNGNVREVKHSTML